MPEASINRPGPVGPIAHGPARTSISSITGSITDGFPRRLEASKTMSSKIGAISSRSNSLTKRAPEGALVAVRYEKTVQAEPPTPMPPRNPSRAPSRAQSTRSPTPSVCKSPSPTFSMRSPSPTTFRSPVVVAPPLAQLVPVAPPAEQHPALRTPVQQARAAQECWKRDSGHAPTPTSSATIREEDDEDGHCFNRYASSRNYSRPWTWAVDDVLTTTAAVPLSVAQHSSRRATGAASSDGQPGFGDLQLSFSDEPRRRSVERHDVAPVLQISAARPVAVSSVSPRSSLSSRRWSQLGIEPPPSPTRQPDVLKRFGTSTKQPPSGTLSPAKGKLSGLASEGIPPLTSPGRVPPAPPAPANPRRPPPQSPSPISLQSGPGLPASNSKPADAAPQSSVRHFKPLGLSIPTGALIDDGFMASLSFSNRGSIMCGDRRLADVSPDEPAAELGIDPTTPAPALELSTATTTTTASQYKKPDDGDGDGDGDGDHAVGDDDATATATATSATLTTQTASLRISPSPPSEVRAPRNDAQKESQKVRSLYGVGGTLYREGSVRCPSNSGPLSPTLEAPSEDEGQDSMRREPCSPGKAIPKSTSFFAYRNDATKFDTELAGGLEDWENVDGADVDRYGFIAVPRLSSQSSTPVDAGTSTSPPRRRPVLHKRDPASSSSRRPPSRKISARSLNTQNSGLSAASIRSSRSFIRSAGNLLPHNRDRRWMDEAGDMLTLAPNMHGAAEEAEIARISECLKHKEWERSEKWRKMAKVIRRGGQGQGMDFEFDIKNPKLIERTWKGIPDRWRATAWWSFLAASAEEHGGLPNEVEMIAKFHQLLERPSPDDVQIDLDVPRTISRHIMFRRRYRGGQRLLFRVLHALSLYFPETGYVQGMASLAATLLCYFDEERCFVMLVRMWQLRGLEYLYKPGFEGLMTTLKEFKESWLNKDVGKKLTELNVDITAYGTRWYLTLFNLSIPFPAQLRVWDVFLLLGDDRSGGPGSMPGARSHGSNQGPGGGLGVLHATSAALIQALSEVLLDSDFENAMKALTSWIPIKDEELLMKVTKAEWKSHQGKRKT